MGLVGRVISSFEIGNSSSGLFYHQKTRRAIPGIELVFIKPIKPPGGYPAKINGSRAQPAHGNTAANKTTEHFQRSIRLIEIGIWKTSYQAGFVDFCLCAHKNRLAIHGGPLTA